MTAGCTMLVSVPVGKLADAWGRKRVFLSGYVVMGMLYLLLLSTPSLGFIVQGGCLILVGLYYAATDGVLAASASAAIPAQSRTSGLAMLSTVVGLGKTGSALLFGWLWQAFGARTAVASFMLALVAALVVATLWIHETRDE
jgi:MFS family permease